MLDVERSMFDVHIFQVHPDTLYLVGGRTIISDAIEIIWNTKYHFLRNLLAAGS